MTTLYDVTWKDHFVTTRNDGLSLVYTGIHDRDEAIERAQRYREAGGLKSATRPTSNGRSARGLINRTALLLALVAIMVQSAHAADLVVLSAAAMKGALQTLPDRYLAATGDHVRLIYGTAGQVRDRAVSGEPFDVVIVPPGPLAKLSALHLVTEGSQVEVARVRLGVAVKAGAALPRIGDDESFTKVLLDAPSIGMADPATGATSGIYLAKLIDRLGIGGSVGPKVKYYPEGQAAMEAMARGEVSVGLGQTSEIRPVQGVTLVGPIPADLQLVTTYAAGMGARSEHPQAAKNLLSWLNGAGMQTSLQANGFDLVPPAHYSNEEKQ